MRKVQYTNDSERQTLLQEAALNGEILIEESNLINGNYLIFEYANEISPPPLADQNPSIEDRIAVLEETVNFLLGL